MAGIICEPMDEKVLEAIADGRAYLDENNCVVSSQEFFFDYHSETDFSMDTVEDLWDRERDLHDDFIEDDPYTFRDHDYNSRSIRTK